MSRFAVISLITGTVSERVSFEIILLEDVKRATILWLCEAPGS
jgi:hypothetical protein